MAEQVACTSTPRTENGGRKYEIHLILWQHWRATKVRNCRNKFRDKM